MLNRQNYQLIFKAKYKILTKEDIYSTWGTLYKILEIVLCKYSELHIDHLWTKGELYIGAASCYLLCAWLATQVSDMCSANVKLSFIFM
jgi:hypothetical protein